MAAARVCLIAGCGKPHRSQGFCAPHYRRWRRLSQRRRHVSLEDVAQLGAPRPKRNKMVTGRVSGEEYRLLRLEAARRTRRGEKTSVHALVSSLVTEWCRAASTRPIGTPKPR